MGMGGSMLLIEGIIQILVGIIIFIMIWRRGKNRLLFALGWFFIAVGIFSTGPYLPRYMMLIPGLASLVAYSSVICHTSIFFGVAGYCSYQMGVLKGNKVIKAAFTIGLLSAFGLVFVHILSLDAVSTAQSYKDILKLYSEWLMYFFFGVSLSLIAFIFLSLAWQLRKEKGAVNYVTTTGIGLGLMLIALVIRKALDLMMPPVNYLVVDILTLVSLGLVIVGAIFQTSLSMSPGFVFDSKTKKAIPLALLKVLRVGKDKVIESRITREDGHYGLLLEPGEYTISVSAKNYRFPTTGTGYKGEKISISKPTVLALDIPLDPEV